MAKDAARLALRFVLIIGVVNLFADLTYEGGRSIHGPFLASLGATAAIVGFTAGLGEMLGYVLRLPAGYVADRTHRYWLITFAGYVINMLAVPALALAGNWPAAASLIVAERAGRALRRPNVETMLSYTGKQIGSGWVFGLNEAMDQGGATVGPLVVSLVLALRGGFRQGFAVLLIPALLCLATLGVARLLYPRPHELEEKTAASVEVRSFSRQYWLYLGAGALIAAGFADFSLIAFHFHRAGSVSEPLIPVFYSVAMASGSLAALLFGRMLDKIGPQVALFAFFLSALAPAFVFLGGFALALAGMALWGVGMGAQDSLLKALLSRVAPSERRSTGFGLFDTGFGIAWFLGSGAMGLLYDRSIAGLVTFSVALQLAALPVFRAANAGLAARDPGGGGA